MTEQPTMPQPTPADPFPTPFPTGPGAAPVLDLGDIGRIVRPGSLPPGWSGDPADTFDYNGPDTDWQDRPGIVPTSPPVGGQWRVQPGPVRDAVALDDGPLTCTEDGCGVQVPDAPDNRCGGPDGGAQGCGELFCADHLWVSEQDGNLCAADYDGTAR